MAEKEEVQAEQDEQAEVPFEDQVKSMEDQVVEELRESLLKAAYEENRQLREINAGLLNDQVLFRDEVALACFVPLINSVADYRTAAIEAYRAADEFTRIREIGGGPDEHTFQLNKDDDEKDK